MGYVYWVIDSAGVEEDQRFRVWRREGVQADLVGAYPSFASARASVPVTWRDAGSDGLSAWALGTAETPMQEATLRATSEAEELIA